MILCVGSPQFQQRACLAPRASPATNALSVAFTYIARWTYLFSHTGPVCLVALPDSLPEGVRVSFTSPSCALCCVSLSSLENKAEPLRRVRRFWPVCPNIRSWDSHLAFTSSRDSDNRFLPMPMTVETMLEYVDESPRTKMMTGMPCGMHSSGNPVHICRHTLTAFACI